MKTAQSDVHHQKQYKNGRSQIPNHWRPTQKAVVRTESENRDPKFDIAHKEASLQYFIPSRSNL